MLAQAGVLVRFCDGGGTPLLMTTKIEWLSPKVNTDPQNTYKALLPDSFATLVLRKVRRYNLKALRT